MRLLPALLAFCFAGGPAALTATEPLRIAVVDLEAVFAAHPTTADATENLTRAREASRDEFKQRSNALKQVLQEHQELIRAGKKEEASKKLIEANEAEKRIATLRTTRMRDLEEEFQRTKKLILSDIRKGLAIFNEDGRYDLILDHSARSSNGLPQVLHAPGAEDITDEVVAFVKTFDPEAAEAP